MKPEAASTPVYFVYILRCGDGSVYTGIAADLHRRIAEHLSRGPRCAKYTKSHPALGAQAAWRVCDRSCALRMESSIKKMTKAQKEQLIAFPASAQWEASFSARRLHITKTGDEIPMLLIGYSKCSTCQKARAFLDSIGQPYQWREITTAPPTEAELRQWQPRSGLPLKRFFNTSGLRYKALGLAEKLSGCSEDKQFALLASDGMLIRRPLLITDEKVLVGFRLEEWNAL